MSRVWTPDRRNATGSGVLVTAKRACNGCDRLLGDATLAEMGRAIAGLPPGDVRGECPDCSPGSAPPAATPPPSAPPVSVLPVVLRERLGGAVAENAYRRSLGGGVARDEVLP